MKDNEIVAKILSVLAEKLDDLIIGQHLPGVPPEKIREARVFVKRILNELSAKLLREGDKYVSKS